jgi:hypothetical protein
MLLPGSSLLVQPQACCVPCSDEVSILISAVSNLSSFRVKDGGALAFVLLHSAVKTLKMTTKIETTSPVEFYVQFTERCRSSRLTGDFLKEAHRIGCELFAQPFSTECSSHYVIISLTTDAQLIDDSFSTAFEFIFTASHRSSFECQRSLVLFYNLTILCVFIQYLASIEVETYSMMTFEGNVINFAKSFEECCDYVMQNGDCSDCRSVLNFAFCRVLIDSQSVTVHDNFSYWLSLIIIFGKVFDEGVGNCDAGPEWAFSKCHSKDGVALFLTFHRFLGNIVNLANIFKIGCFQRDDTYFVLVIVKHRMQRMMPSWRNKISSRTGFGGRVEMESFAISDCRISGECDGGIVDDLKQIQRIGGGSLIVKPLSQQGANSLSRFEISVIDFHRRKIVQCGEKCSAAQSVKSLPGRVWISTTIDNFQSYCDFISVSVESIIFENDSKLIRIDESAFSHSGLKSIIIPSSVEILCQSCFRYCRSLESIIFENDSKLIRIGELAFSESGLKSIIIPSSVEILCKSWIEGCRSLEPILFENESN